MGYNTWANWEEKSSLEVARRSANCKFSLNRNLISLKQNNNL